MTPLLLGGKQEQGRRAGTENVPIILSMLAALEVREKQMMRSEHILRGVWRENFERQLLHKLPGTVIYVGAGVPRLWEHGFGTDAGWLAITLADAARQGRVCGVHRFRLYERAKEACHTCWPAMNFKSAEAHRVLRFSGGWETPEASWDALIDVLTKVHAEVHHAKA